MTHRRPQRASLWTALILLLILTGTASAQAAKTPATTREPTQQGDLADVWNTFKAASVADRQRNTMEDAADAFAKARETADTPEIRLQCQVMTMFCRLLSGTLETPPQEAAQTVMQDARATDLAEEALNQLEAARGLLQHPPGDIQPHTALAEKLGLSEDAAQLARQLNRLQRRQTRVRKRLADRWAKTREKIEASITQWCTQEKLNPDTFDNVRKTLQAHMQKHGHVPDQTIKDALIERSLEILVQ